MARAPSPTEQAHFPNMASSSCQTGSKEIQPKATSRLKVWNTHHNMALEPLPEAERAAEEIILMLQRPPQLFPGHYHHLTQLMHPRDSALEEEPACHQLTPQDHTQEAAQEGHHHPITPARQPTEGDLLREERHHPITPAQERARKHSLRDEPHPPMRQDPTTKEDRRADCRRRIAFRGDDRLRLRRRDRLGHRPWE